MSLSLRAYPAQLIETHVFAGGSWVVLRPVRPEDEPMIAALLAGLSTDSRYQRHFAFGTGPDLALLARMRGADYTQILGLVAVTVENGLETIIGLAEYAALGDNAEFAMVVADHWQRRGLGARMLDALIRCAESAGIAELYGHTMATNRGMAGLARRLGFSISRGDDASVLRLSLQLPHDDERVAATHFAGLGPSSFSGATA